MLPKAKIAISKVIESARGKIILPRADSIKKDFLKVAGFMQWCGIMMEEELL